MPDRKDVGGSAHPSKDQRSQCEGDSLDVQSLAECAVKPSSCGHFHGHCPIKIDLHGCQHMEA